MPSSKTFVEAPENGGCSRFVFRNLNGSKHRAVHSLEGNQVAAGIGYCYVHLPISHLGLCYSSVNNRLGTDQVISELHRARQMASRLERHQEDSTT